MVQRVERTDRVGCERVLVQAQWALLAASGLGALAIPLLEGTAQVLLLLCSTLLWASPEPMS